MKELIFCAIVLFTAGCAPDPLGITERTQIRANAAVNIAAEERKAEEAKARALVNAEIARQVGLQTRTSTVAVAVPIIVLIIVAGGIVALVIHWRGKLAMVQMRQRLAAPLVTPKLPTAWEARLAKRGCHSEWNGSGWWVIDNATGLRWVKPITLKMVAATPRMLEAKR